MNRSYSNYINPQQYSNYAKNIAPKVIISNSQNFAVQKMVGYNNNINNTINNSKTYNNNFAPKLIKMNSRNNKKNAKVKFNENVSVIKVVSYKEYNKLDDSTCLDDVYNGKTNKHISNYVSTDPNNIDKKTKNCECNIM